MKVRHAAVMAGLALGLMSGAVFATPLTYNVDYSVAGNQVSGFIETDGTIGSLSSSNLVNYEFEYLSTSLAKSNTPIANIGSLNATALDIYVDFNAGNTVFAGNGRQVGFFSGGQFFDAGYNLVYNGDVAEQVASGSTLTIATVSAVPLPSSAPMFGAALLALGAVGYSLKRKGKAAV